MSTVTFNIGKEYFFNNGELIIPHIADKSGVNLKIGITNWLCQNYTFADTTHKSKQRGSWSGFNADEINKELRKTITSISGIHGETHIEYGGLLHSAKKGFDFSLYDEDCNYIKIRNACIGHPGMYNGDKTLDSLYKKLREKTDDKKRMKKKDWLYILSTIPTPPGENAPEIKKEFTVVGEIQFGNWALAEHDLLRLINSSVKNSIDFYIYIAPTGKLSQKISTGVVTYEKVLEAITENSQLLSIPMWIIGLDI